MEVWGSSLSLSSSSFIYSGMEVSENLSRNDAESRGREDWVWSDQ